MKKLLVGLFVAMKPLLIVLSVFSLFFGTLNTYASNFVCSNRNNFKSALDLTIVYQRGSYKAKAVYENNSCNLTQVRYRPTSPQYQGWIRVGTGSGNCAKIGLSLFGKNMNTGNPIGVYWISVSNELQNGQDGFIQIGYENDADPGAGPHAKVFLRCLAN